MPLTLLKNLSFRTSLYLVGEVVKAKPSDKDKSDTDPASFHWFVEITMAMPSDKAPVSKKRVRYPGPDAAHEALKNLVQEINDLEAASEEEEEEEEEEEDEEELDDISEVEN